MTPHENRIHHLRDLLATIANVESEANGDEFISQEDAQANLNMCVECAQEALELLGEVLT